MPLRPDTTVATDDAALTCGRSGLTMTLCPISANVGTRRACRDLRSLLPGEGHFVLDMGMVGSVQVEDGVAKVELLLTSRWCPFAASVLTEVKDQIMASPGSATPTCRSSGTRPGRAAPPSPRARDILRFLPPPAAVADRRSTSVPICPQRSSDDRRRLRLRLRGARLQLRPEDAFGNPGLMFDNHPYAFHNALTPERPAQAAARGVPRQWTPSDIRKMHVRGIGHRHAGGDVTAADRPVP